jgi:digeranylgeranylglycerophospholipid reductase
MVAIRLARAGFKSILFEKRPRIGLPVRCGEATGNRTELARFLPIDEKWISADINAARLIAPGGRILERSLPGIGVVLDRGRFDQALADLARTAGAEVRPDNEVIDLIEENGSVAGVRVRDHASGRSYQVRAAVTVGADGIECSVGRRAGLTRHLGLADIHSAFQYLIEADDLPLDTIEFYTGRSIAPGGYAWVFPKGPGLANVGLGIQPSPAGVASPQELLDRFVAGRYPGARIRATVAGGTSGTKPLKTMVADGLLLVGEAAHQNNPLSGGGIMNALEGAALAADVLAEALSRGDTGARALEPYNRHWARTVGSSIHKNARLRKFFYQLSDHELDDLAAVLQGFTHRSGDNVQDYAEILKNALMKVPGLVWKARKLLW